MQAWLQLHVLTPRMASAGIAQKASLLASQLVRGEAVSSGLGIAARGSIFLRLILTP